MKDISHYYQDEGHAADIGTPAELIRLAALIREHQRLADATDVAWCRRHPALGSTKTYARIARGDIEQLDHARWLADYRAVAALLDATADAGPAEELYHDLGPAIALRAALTSAMRDTSNRRLILMMAEPGMGKTSAAAAVAQRYGTARVRTAEADETWKDSAGAMLSGLGTSLGLRELPAHLNGRVDVICSTLSSARTCLIIDEAHHLGLGALNLCKTILNRTPGEMVFLCLPTLWRRLETTAYDEARQLTTNRLHERIHITGIDPADARRLIQRRCGDLGGRVDDAAALIRRNSVRRGGYSWIAAVCQTAQRLHAAQGGDAGAIDLETFAAAAARAEALRGHAA